MIALSEYTMEIEPLVPRQGGRLALAPSRVDHVGPFKMNDPLRVGPRLAAPRSRVK